MQAVQVVGATDCGRSWVPDPPERVEGVEPAAEPSPDPELDGLMDSAQPERFRGALPTVRRLTEFRDVVAQRVHTRIGNIADGQVGAPAQLTIVATHLLTAVINHEYQHDQWISEVRQRDLGHALPDRPTSERIVELDGYLVVGA